MNLVVVQGLVREEPLASSLSSGEEALSFELSVRNGDDTIEPVPVVCYGTPVALEVDDEVVIVGRVRKRFYRAGGATQSRTEVVAARVVPARRRTQVNKAIDDAIEQLSARG
jgi:single-strand DNA-binding protein